MKDIMPAVLKPAKIRLSVGLSYRRVCELALLLCSLDRGGIDHLVPCMNACISSRSILPSLSVFTTLKIRS